MSQRERSFLNLAGEFLVAGHLNRLQVEASITYGNSKSADIFAFCSIKQRVARIEVKTTDKKRWPVGARAICEDSAQMGVFWVLVRLPKDQSAPEYYVFSGREIVDLTSRLDGEYKARYKKKHGVPYKGAGLPALNLAHVVEYKDKWQTLLDYFDLPKKQKGAG
jgi:hypothetical protein